MSLHSMIYFVLICLLGQGHAEDISSEEASESSAAKLQEILRSMNLSHSACDDFEAFSCGNFSQNETAQDQLDLSIKFLLSMDDEKDTPGDRKVKNVYRSCLEAAKAWNPFWPNQMRDIFQQFGEMPAMMAGEWPEHNFDWSQTVALMAFEYNIHILTSIHVGPDEKDKSKLRLYIRPAQIPKQRRTLYLQGDKGDMESLVLERIQEHLVNFLALNVTAALKTAQEIMEFERSLHKAMAAEADLQLISLEELQLKFLPDWNIKHHVDIALGQIPLLKVAIQTSYHQHLLALLKQSSRQTVANYVYYRLMEHFSLELTKCRRRRQWMCLQKTKDLFGQQIDRMLYRQFSNKDAEENIQQLWQNLKATFEGTLELPYIQWIQDETRNYAKQKLRAMKLQISSQEPRNFSQQWQHVNVDSAQYVENLRAIYSAKARQARDRLKESSAYDLPQHPSLRPLYNHFENKVILPVFFLLPQKVWSSHYPQFLQYATLGSLLAHEILHAFDAQGQLFDSQGLHRLWWDKKSLLQYAQNRECLNDQYQHSVGAERGPTTDLILQENVAENGGLALAYDAYVSWYTNASEEMRQSQEEQLMEWSYDHIQMFFIAYGNLWCTNDFALNELEDIEGKDVAKGALINFSAFHEVFNCTGEAGMKPAKQCVVF